MLDVTRPLGLTYQTPVVPRHVEVGVYDPRRQLSVNAAGTPFIEAAKDKTSYPEATTAVDDHQERPDVNTVKD